MPDVPLVIRVAANLAEMRTNLAEGVSQIETYKTALSRAAAAFDGSRVVTQASAAAAAIQNAGGVTALTATEMARANVIFAQAAEKLQLMGQGGSYTAQRFTELAAATKQAENAGQTWAQWLTSANGLLATFGIGLSIQAVLGFGKALFDDADALELLHDKSDISVESLQRMRIAGDDAHVALEAMTAGVNMLQKRLGGDDQSASRALVDFGLNVEHFKALDPASQMAALATAVQNTHDPLRLATDLAGLFGKSWAEMVPVLKRGFKEVTDQATVMSDESVKALDDWGDAAGRFWRATKGAFGEALADVLTLSLSDLRHLNSELKNLPAPPDGAAYTNFYRALVPPGVPHDLEELTAKMDEQIKASIKTKEAMVELNSVGTGWRGTLETIDGAVLEGIKYYLEAGVAQDKLATAYGLTAAQVKAVGTELKEEQAALKLQAEGIEQVTKLWDEFNQLASKGGSTFDDQVAAIDRWALDLEAKAQKAGTDTKEFYDALTALWNAKLHEAAQNASRAMEDTANIAINSFESMNSAVMGITVSFAGWNDEIMNVQRALDGTIIDTEKLAEAQQKLRDAGNALDTGTAAQDPEIMALLHQGWSLKNAEAIKLARQWGFSPKLYDEKGNPESTPSAGERVPGYEKGVLNAPGGWATVGERGPERMYVPPGANIYPTGTSSGSAITIAPGAIVMHYPIMRDARAVSELTNVLVDGLLKKLVGMGFRATPGA